MLLPLEFITSAILEHFVSYCPSIHITNHQQTRVYTLFAIRSFPVNRFSLYFQKSANANFSFSDAQSYCLEERSHA